MFERFNSSCREKKSWLRCTYIKRSIPHLIFLTGLFQTVSGQPVTDNPYSTFYNVRGHWTDALKWGNVTFASDVPKLMDSGKNVDSVALHKAIKDISDKGGGTMYFPAGEYYFGFDIQLSSGVILRGEEPANSKIAKEPHFRPQTHFIFPKYVPSSEGLGTPNSTAFKRITSKVGIRNFGIVYIDVNRARIDFYSNWPTEVHDRVIVFGIRQNNAVTPEITVPSRVQIDHGRGWQRWPAMKANIAVCIEKEAVVANCLLNDSITDNFEQFNYMTNDGYVFGKDSVPFDFLSHWGVTAYRKSVSKSTRSEVIDNYIVCSKYFLKVRLKGEGVMVERNEFVDPKVEPQPQILEDNYSIAFADQVNNMYDSGKYIVGQDTLVYQLLKPEIVDPKKKYPLFVFFHGNGERGKGEYHLKHLVYLFTTEANRREFPCYVLVPHCEKDKNWNSENLEGSPTLPMQMAIQLVNKMERQSDICIDKKRIYVAGISIGGRAAWEATLRYPDIFAATVPVAAIWSFDRKQLELLKNKSIWISTAVHDPQVRVEYVRFMKEQLLDSKIDVNYNEYPEPNVGHLSWIPLSADKNFLPWLFSKKK